MCLMNWSPLALTYSHIKGFMAQEKGGERRRAISTRDEVKLHHADVWRERGILRGWMFISVRLCVCKSATECVSACTALVCELTSRGSWVCADFCMWLLFVQFVCVCVCVCVWS